MCVFCICWFGLVFGFGLCASSPLIISCLIIIIIGLTGFILLGSEPQVLAGERVLFDWTGLFCFPLAFALSTFSLFGILWLFFHNTFGGQKRIKKVSC